MDINKGRFLSIEQLQSQYLNNSNQIASARKEDVKSFKEILTSKTADADINVKFSKHAANRLASRNIELTDNQIGRLQEGTQKAQAKGIKESLVLVDSLAFIVNIPSNTVVTAMNQTETDENIFTNIDGAVIM